MKNQDQLLKHILGSKGLEKLSKSMYRRDSKSVLSPIDMYLPILAVPRALLSWLVQNVQGIEIGDSTVLNIPTMPKTDITINKTGRDSYSAQFVEEGNVIHTFENQTLPAVGGHLMSIGEMYDYEQPEQSSSLDVPAHIMQESGFQSQVPDNVTAIIAPVMQMMGKVIDALVAKQMVQSSIDEVLVEKAATPMGNTPSGQAGPSQPQGAQDPYKPSKNPQIGVNNTKEQRQDRSKAPAVMKSNYFQGLRSKNSHFQKTESGCVISEDLLYTPCNECGISEFSKTESGPKYRPCACFQVTLETEKFVTLKKSEGTGLYEIKFNKKEDKQLVTAFLLTLRDRLDQI